MDNPFNEAATTPNNQPCTVLYYTVLYCTVQYQVTPAISEVPVEINYGWREVVGGLVDWEREEVGVSLIFTTREGRVVAVSKAESDNCLRCRQLVDNIYLQFIFSDTLCWFQDGGPGMPEMQGHKVPLPHHEVYGEHV